MLAQLVTALVIALLKYLEQRAKKPKTAETAVRQRNLLRRIRVRVQRYEDSIRSGGHGD